MGATKSWAMEIIIKAEMSEQTFNRIDQEVRDEMKIKAIEAANFKDEYKKNHEWKVCTGVISQALKDRSKIEDEIRLNLKE